MFNPNLLVDICTVSVTYRWTDKQSLHLQNQFNDVNTKFRDNHIVMTNALFKFIPCMLD